MADGESKGERSEGSPTVDPLVGWGTWMASCQADRPAPHAAVVFGVLLGIPLALGLLIWAAATWLP